MATAEMEFFPPSYSMRTVALGMASSFLAASGHDVVVVDEKA